ncbi:transposase [Bradyrhizobium sp. CCGUVB23]|uniref:IS66 family transposase n=1 Tax=Bradyrhizobium sp. CCGUVB23 TaxID=2949630 RepID=UPI00353218ED
MPVLNTRTMAHLMPSGGVHSIGYAAYKGLIKNGGHLVQLAFCFAHARRKFWDVHVATKSPIAAEALLRRGDQSESAASIKMRMPPLDGNVGRA